MRLRRILTGGQTGADQVALKVALAFGLETGGWAPKGFKTEDGAAPWLRDYGLVEAPTFDYAARTRLNMDAADMALILAIGAAGLRSRRSILVTYGMLSRGKPVWAVDLASGHVGCVPTTVEQVRGHDPETLMIGGNRRSTDPRIDHLAEDYLRRLFAELLGHSPKS